MIKNNRHYIWPDCTTMGRQSRLGNWAWDPRPPQFGDQLSMISRKDLADTSVRKEGKNNFKNGK